ncbi:unnamed protein product [Ceutorhynchus assimilis]|uniref:Defensin n=1 Tax=Ceutorhynchus assimilis TaxID=467358 RepID=A0A9N9MM41_9CUCU|nr:unnamed protein product [Ceutorhynchus assimilis]
MATVRMFLLIFATVIFVGSAASTELSLYIPWMCTNANQCSEPCRVRLSYQYPGCEPSRTRCFSNGCVCYCIE